VVVIAVVAASVASAVKGRGAVERASAVLELPVLLLVLLSSMTELGVVRVGRRRRGGERVASRLVRIVLLVVLKLLVLLLLLLLLVRRRMRRRA